MVARYVNERLQARGDLKQVQANLIEAATVVPVALDLGIVLLRRAQSMNDPAQREAELQQAEKTFLAIRTVAGESDEYRLFLGQVYYWLGKHQEGRKLFDELLAANNRNWQTLVGVGRLLREVGAANEASVMFEEAYENGPDEEKKQSAAHLRALSAVGTEEQILWLERSNQADVSVKAMLFWSKGVQAIAKGNETSADRYLRQAIDAYARMPESASSLNNEALAWFALFQVTRDPADSANGIERLEKALSMSPGDSITLNNAANNVLNVSIRELIGGDIDLKALKQPANMSHVAFLYRDHSERAALKARFQRHPGIAKARSYYERLLVLAPKQPGTYIKLGGLLAYLDDQDGIERLHQQLIAAELNTLELAAGDLEFAAGIKDDEMIEQFNVVLKPLTSYCALPPARRDPVTFAVAVSVLSRTKMALARTGRGVDAEELVTLAEAAYAASPSSGARGALVRALGHLAHDKLKKQNQDYAALAQPCQRTLGGDELIWLVYPRQDALGEAARSLPEFKRIDELMAQRRERFPQHGDIWHWRALRDVRPDEAAVHAAALKQYPVDRIAADLSNRLSPGIARYALERAWWYELDDQPAAAAQTLDAVVQLGVALPAELR